jgi:NADPH:quinone reductase-like Zn-dependent oxidoreductase
LVLRHQIFKSRNDPIHESRTVHSSTEGGYAEFIKVPAQNLVSIPDDVSFVKAAAFPLTFLTAWHMLMTRAQLKHGDDVLILAAGSGVGQAAIQVAFLHGARLTNHRGVDVVIEHVGESTWPQNISSLACGGRLVTCGATTGVNAAIDLRVLFRRQLSMSGSYLGSNAELMRAARFLFAGQLDPVVDRTFPLQDAADAHRHLENGQPFGKIILDVA